MRGVFLLGPDADGRAPTPVGPTRRGGVSARSASPDGFPLWLQRLVLDDGAELEWESGHGEEALYVVSGALELDGRRAPAGGAVVLEAGATPVAVACGATEVVHMGAPARPGPPAGAAVHVVGPGGTHALEAPGRATRFFADSECEGCSVTLFVTGRDGAHESAAHSHSADELIHVLDGSIRVGRTELGPGSTVAVAADRRYGFRSDGFRFLNYRPGPSWLTRERGSDPMREGPALAGFEPVMDLR